MGSFPDAGVARYHLNKESTPDLRRLRLMLAGLSPTWDIVQRLARDVGVKPACLRDDPMPENLELSSYSKHA